MDPIRSEAVHATPLDNTPPPQPRIARSESFLYHDAKPGLYLELDNVEPGTRFELINLAADPSARFDEGKEIRLRVQAHDLQERKASILEVGKPMIDLGLQPGDSFLLRAVDAAGNPSQAVHGKLRVTAGRGRQLPDVLMNTDGVTGEGIRTSLKGVSLAQDARAPGVSWQRVKFRGDLDRLELVGEPGAVEPGRELRFESPPGSHKFQVGGPVRTNEDGSFSADLSFVAESRAKVSAFTVHVLDHSVRSDAKNQEATQTFVLADGAWRAYEPTDWKANDLLGSLSVEAQPDGSTVIEGGGFVRPGDYVEIQDQTTGRLVQAKPDKHGRVRVDLADLELGNMLRIQPVSVSGEQGQFLLATYDPAAPAGLNPVVLTR